uniref:Uncharacterized protein n=1 Tax=Dulem virus 36 TaxID=3145754 RepID=A0AAU8B176_9CAUD
MYICKTYKCYVMFLLIVTIDKTKQLCYNKIKKAILQNGMGNNRLE